MKTKPQPGQLFALEVYKKNNFIYGILLQENESLSHPGKYWRALIKGRVTGVFVEGDYFYFLS
jgi:hypothetical protein